MYVESRNTRYEEGVVGREKMNESGKWLAARSVVSVERVGAGESYSIEWATAIVRTSGEFSDGR